MYSTNMLKNKFLSFILFALVTYSASAIGGMATIGFKEPWYSLLINHLIIHLVGFLHLFGQPLFNDDNCYMDFLAQ